MQVWRLVAHHKESEMALQQMKENGRIAIGWSRIGDLYELDPKSANDIALRLPDVSPDTPTMMAGPSLWNLYNKVSIGDQVIVTAKGKRECVFEVTGNYVFDEKNSILGYSHQRPAALTDIDPEKLWLASDSTVMDGENVRWTLVKLKGTGESENIVHLEGKRYSVSSTAIERDKLARQKCLDHYGYRCNVCQMSFEERYGEIGKNYIHVHHKMDLAYINGEHIVDPIADLIPLCPNCHAMAHTETPAMSVDRLKNIFHKKNS